MFKLLKLKRSDANKLEFKKKEGGKGSIHDFKLKPMI